MSDLNDKQITDIANFHHVGRDTNGMRLFTDYSLLAFARAILASRTQPEATPAAPTDALKEYSQRDLLMMHDLSRKLLWLAYVWNDHNFGAAHLEARRVAEAWGIKSFDDANRYLEKFTAPAQDLSAAILALPLPNTNLTAEVAGYKVPVYGAQHMRDFAMSALASPADALRAGDRVDLDNWNTQMAGVQALLECTDGELECISEGPLNAYIEHVKRIYAAILQSQKDNHG